ncbi:MAG: hypothetical protein ONB44_17940 [candidate division KSB1 bacterium]|nr:hypothetical protein [candidate division KSB1 bacterium]MDZ7304009.1 hypothetical protein [candidate division KSB1 bacterium]MDZ7313281.1 hypothetical protein [candidate division KSB1 bacterium]
MNNQTNMARFVRQISTQGLIVSLTILLLTPVLRAKTHEVDSLMARARLLYYESMGDKNKINSAIALFTTIGQLDQSLKGRTQTYIGSLTAVKARFAFWPHLKWKTARHGLRIMDEGLAQNPADIEALFIHGTTCYYLPKFFGRTDDAQRHLRAIIRLLPAQVYNYDPEIIANVITFITEKIELNDEERRDLMAINARLAQQ